MAAAKVARMVSSEPPKLGASRSARSRPGWRCRCQISCGTGMAPAVPIPRWATCCGKVPCSVCCGLGLVSEGGEMSTSRGSGSATAVRTATRWLAVCIHVPLSCARFRTSMLMFRSMLPNILWGHSLAQSACRRLQCVVNGLQSGLVCRRRPEVAVARVWGATSRSASLAEARAGHSRQMGPGPLVGPLLVVQAGLWVADCRQGQHPAL